MPGEDGHPAPWPRRIGWLLLIWLASVSALAVAAFAVRLLMNAAGLTA